jgi:2-hydroxy-6-oxonona-2,4-dienedioate hydrolase
MTTMITGYLDLGDGKLYYEVSETPGATETLVLNHAAFLDSRMWDEQWAAFTRHYRVIRYDMIGYGRSSVASGPRTRRDDLHRLLRHLDVERAHLLGCSMGGEIIIDLALEQPSLAASLVIVNGAPSGFEPQGEPPAHLFEMITATQQGDVELASELQLRIWFDGPYRQPDEVNARARRRASEMNRLFVSNQTWLIADMQPANPLTPPAIGRLHELQAPTLIITGALDHAENLRAAALMSAQIPGARQVSIPEAAHVPNLDQPERFNQRVVEFLNSL